MALKKLPIQKGLIKMTTNQEPNQALKKRWLNIEELTHEYGFSKSSQYQLRKSKQIPFTQIKASSKTNKNNGSVRYDRYLIDAWLEDNRRA
jgi:predicted DNA-binding transcriptional regulator AlpA